MKRLFNIVYGERLSKYRIEGNIRAYAYNVASEYLGRDTVDLDSEWLFDRICLSSVECDVWDLWNDIMVRDDTVNFMKSIASGVLDAVIELKGVAVNVNPRKNMARL